MVYAVIRVRGQADVNCDVRHTMKLLGITKVNHCVIVPEDDITKGMLQKAKDYITWGEVSEATIADMIRTRGKICGDESLTDEYIKENSDFQDADGMAKAIASGEYRMKDVEGAKMVFRLHPPVKGYEGNKRSFRNGGALGYRGEAINNLIARML